MTTTKTRNRCACGTVIRKDARECSTCHDARIEGFKAAARAHVARGTCPDCGTTLQPNSSLAGWWQCGAFATPSFRKPEHRHLPSCHFQCFTE